MARKHKHELLGRVGERGDVGDAGTWSCPDGCGETAKSPTLGDRLRRLVGAGKPLDGSDDAGDEDDEGTEMSGL
jgi:hypothetical protein